jgi:hypothetical protein
VIDIYQFVEPIVKVVVVFPDKKIENDAALIPWKDAFRK